MKVTTQELETCEVLMTVEIDDKQRDRLLQKAARRLARRVQIPGFRPGKAPYRVILHRFGEEVIREEAIEDLTGNIFRDALEEADVIPFAQASLDNIEWEPVVTMTVKVPTEPVVELGDYREVRLDLEPVEVTDEELDAELSQIQEEMATYDPVERPIEMGDIVSVNLTAVDVETGTAIESDVERDLTLVELDDASQEPDYATNLMGLTVGSEQEFTHTFPAEYSDSRYADKEVGFTVKINNVMVKTVDDIDDDFAGLVGDFDTLDDLKAQLRNDITERKEREAESEQGEAMLNQVIEQAAEIKWPPALEEEELNQMMNGMNAELGRLGANLEIFLRSQGKSLEQFREENRENAVQRIKRQLVLNKIASLEKLEVGNDELTQRIEQVVQMSGNNEEAVRMATSSSMINMLANDILAQKAQERLLLIAKGEAPEILEETSDAEAAAATDAVVEEDLADTEPAATDDAESTEGTPVAETPEEPESKSDSDPS